jgi:CHAT domain-containing protein
MAVPNRGTMQWQIISALLAVGILCANGPILQAQAGGPAISEQQASSRNRGAADKGGSSGSAQADRRRVVPPKRAETTFQNAIALRDKQTGKGLADAVELFGQSARLFESAHANDSAADAYVHAGEIYFTLSQYERARRSFRKALNLGKDREVRCKALSRMARTYATTGPSSLADHYSSEGMNLCEGLSEERQAEALQARGEALDYTGQRLNNEDYYVRARDLFAAANDRNGQAQALLMLAYHALFSGDNQGQGLESAAQALQLWSSMQDRRGIARMRSLLATFAVVRGEFETAQCNYKVSRPIFRNIGDKDNEGVVLNGLGYVSWELGDWQKSLEHYQNARAIFASLKDQLGEIEAISGMGKALTALKSYKSVLPLYAAELRLARQMGDPLAVAHALQDMAAAYEAEHRYAQAAEFYRSSLNSYRAANNLYSEGEVLIRLGHLQASQKRYEEAINSLEQAKLLEKKIGRIAEVAKVWYELAFIYRRLDRLRDARLAIENSIEIIEKQRVKISDFESRASYFASVHLYYALYIQVLMSLHQQEPALGYAAKAFDAAERSKVRSLLDLLSTSAQDAPCDELLERQLKIARDVVAVKTDAISATASLPPSVLTMQEVQTLIEADDTVLLEYALGEDKSYLWVIDQHHTSAHELPSMQQIKSLVTALRKALSRPQWKEGETALEYQARARRKYHDFQAYSSQLSRLLLAPAALPPTKRVLIVPDGCLQYLPFAALPLPNPTMGKSRLVDSMEVVILPSASALGSLRKAGSKRASPTAIAAIFADPVFESDDPRVLTGRGVDVRRVQDRPSTLSRAIHDVGASEYIPRLPASRDEATAITNVLRSRDPQAVHVALDFDANRAYVLADGLARFRLLHFATHGVVDTRHPEMSGLILSLVDNRGNKQDGYLRLGDIYKLKLSADLVVLSSCDSALGKDLDSEGIIGLPRGFLYAGAKSVIASLWKVNDDATATLMSRLYARIKKGESPGAALRGAQLEMIRDEQWSNPYYWAAFVLQGDYK